jgi:hypothetical protein
MDGRTVFPNERKIHMTSNLLFRGLAAILPAYAPARATPVARKKAGHNAWDNPWMTDAIRRNMSARARRLMRSGD